MKTILAPVDFSPATERVCSAAADLAKGVRGHVVLLHSVPPPIITTEFAPMVEDIAAITAANEKAAARRLARLVQGLRLRRIKVGKGPHGLCVYPQPGRYSLGHTGIFR